MIFHGRLVLTIIYQKACYLFDNTGVCCVILNAMIYIKLRGNACQK